MPYFPKLCIRKGRVSKHRFYRTDSWIFTRPYHIFIIFISPFSTAIPISFIPYTTSTHVILHSFFSFRVFVVNIMIPGPPFLSFVAYLEGDKVRFKCHLFCITPHMSRWNTYETNINLWDKYQSISSPSIRLFFFYSSINLLYYLPIRPFIHGHPPFHLLCILFSPSLSFQSKIEEDTPFGRVARPFFNGNDDEFRNNRFKLIPKVPSKYIWSSFYVICSCDSSFFSVLVFLFIYSLFSFPRIGIFFSSFIFILPRHSLSFSASWLCS